MVLGVRTGDGGVRRGAVERAMSDRKLKFIYDGVNAGIFDAETGQRIDNVVAIALELTPAKERLTVTFAGMEAKVVEEFKSISERSGL